jgi:spore coat polysaccharide biosynthesis predicted glycosyltransferase SpsG
MGKNKIEKVLFKTTASNNIGFGHLFRCLSLAEALKLCGINSVFLANAEAERTIREYGFDFVRLEGFNNTDIGFIKRFAPRIVVLDSYLADPRYLEQLSSEYFLVQFDDNNDIYGAISADILINGNIHAGDLNYIGKKKRTRFLLGPEYLVMKSEYWNLESFDQSEKSLLITTGGADFFDLMPEFLEAVDKLPMKKRVVIGPGFSESQIRKLEMLSENIEDCELIHKPLSLKEYIAQSSIVISASGSTIYEILTMKRLPVIFTLADNQRMIAKKLESFGITNLGWYENIDFKKLPEIILREMDIIDTKKRRLSELFSKFDGKGAMRASKVIVDEVKKWKSQK